MADGILWQLAANAGSNWGQQFDAGLQRGEQRALKNNRRSILQSLTMGPDGNLDVKSGVTQLIQAGDPEGALQIGQLHKAFAPEMTDEIKEYNLYRSQGGADNFNDWKIKLKQAGATRINNVVQTGDNQYAKELAGLNAKNDHEIQQRGLKAATTLGTINQMERLVTAPGFYSGVGGENVLRVKQMLKGLGVNTEGVPEGELFRALSNKLVLDATGGSLGVAISNADRDFLAQTTANLGNSPDGNRQLLQSARLLAQREQQVAKWAREYKAMNRGQLDAGFQDFLAKKAEDNPLFPKTNTQQVNPLEAEMRRRGLLK